LVYICCCFPFYHSQSSFFSRHGALRALRSFPTRRSSDLDGVVDAPEEAQRLGVSLSGLVKTLQPFHCQPHAVEGAGRLLAVAGADRKSTRLNSSHVKISYAVFCLKKKKRKQSMLSSQSQE